MRNAEIGAQTQNVVTMGIVLPEAKYTSLEARREFYDRLLERIQRVPGVQAVSVSTEVPLEGGNNGYVTVEGNTDPALKNQLVEWNNITPDYFRAFGIPLLQGRDFTAADLDRTAELNLKINDLIKKDPNAKIPPDFTLVAVINRKMAQTYWPGQDPIGKVFNGYGVSTKVIGVAGDVKEWGIREETIPEAYYPLTAILDGPGFGTRVTVKASVAATSVLGSIRGELRGLDGELAVFRARTMDQVISESMEDTSVQTMLLGIFAALALALAAGGIYGVMAYVVAQQTHEIGVRMALGAQRSNVLAMVLGRGTKLIVLGVGIGVVTALGLTSLMRSLLFGVRFTDPLTFVGVAHCLTLAALTACYIPARRATRVDPMVALRYE